MPSVKGVLNIDLTASRATAEQEFYHTKVQRKMSWFCALAAAFCTLLAIVEVVVLCVSTELHHTVLRVPFENMHLVLIGCVLVWNLAVQALGIYSAKRLIIRGLVAYIVLQAIATLLAALLIVFTFVHFESYALLAVRICLFAVYVLSILPAFKMHKIAVHEKADE